MSLGSEFLVAAQGELVLMLFFVFSSAGLLVLLLHHQKFIHLLLVEILAQGALSLCNLNL